MRRERIDRRYTADAARARTRRWMREGADEVRIVRAYAGWTSAYEVRGRWREAAEHGGRP